MKDWIVWLQQQMGIEKVIETNQATSQFGLVLSKQDAELMLTERVNILKKERRVEFGESILPKIIYEFCDSVYIMQDNYVETLLRLQEIFFLYKNEMHDEITDDELLHFMKEQYETVCFGDLEYLESTCLANFAQAIRAGYRGYKTSEGYGEYEKFDEVKRWDAEIYYETLKELFW